MSSFEKRLERLAASLGGYQPICPACRNEPVFLIDRYEEDRFLRRKGEPCRRCGSPDATVIVLRRPCPCAPRVRP
jgi:hypothetical protein